MPELKPAYLIHGDDHGRIAERRARLRALGEAQSGAQGVEILDGDAATPAAVAYALSATTMAFGRRIVIVEGVERWKDRELEPLVEVLGAMPPDTTVAFFAREEGRTKAPDALHAAVKSASGDVATESAVKPWELPKWAQARARELGVELDLQAARALVAHVGDRQQRLLRELERVALELGEGARLDIEDVEELTARSGERKVWTLADALVARDAPAATLRYLELREQGERLTGLLYWMAQRVRTALDVATRLDAGETIAEVKRSLRMPPKAADAFLTDVRRTDGAALRAALIALADLELASRGGGDAPASEDTAAVRTITAIAAA